MLVLVVSDVLKHTRRSSTIESLLDTQIYHCSTNTHKKYFTNVMCLNSGLVPRPYLEGRATVDTCL